jgi:hypothetical protein
MPGMTRPAPPGGRMTRFLAAPGRPQPPRTLTMQTTPRARHLPVSYLAPGDTDPSGGPRPAHVACTARIIRAVLRLSGEPVTVCAGCPESWDGSLPILRSW